MVKENKEYKRVVFLVTEEMFELLRKDSYEKHKPVGEICRELLEAYFSDELHGHHDIKII